MWDLKTMLMLTQLKIAIDIKLAASIRICTYRYSPRLCANNITVSTMS